MVSYAAADATPMAPRELSCRGSSPHRGVAGRYRRSVAASMSGTRRTSPGLDTLTPGHRRRTHVVPRNTTRQTTPSTSDLSLSYPKCLPSRSGHMGVKIVMQSPGHQWRLRCGAISTRVISCAISYIAARREVQAGRPRASNTGGKCQTFDRHLRERHLVGSVAAFEHRHCPIRERLSRRSHEATVTCRPVGVSRDAVRIKSDGHTTVDIERCAKPGRTEPMGQGHLERLRPHGPAGSRPKRAYLALPQVDMISYDGHCLNGARSHMKGIRTCLTKASWKSSEPD
jgi:hypothetical protein